MEKQENRNLVKEPNFAYGSYTYADYLTWQLDGMVELIRGKVFRQAAAPRRIHEELSVALVTRIHGFLKGGTCRVYTAPFDVRLPISSKDPTKIDTVVQPDLCVVCDPEKLDELGCVGAPDLIVEILSPGNNKKELQSKYEVYEASGVKEYWIIHPVEQTLLIYLLEGGTYHSSRLFTLGDRVKSQALPGFELDLDDVFGEL